MQSTTSSRPPALPALLLGVLPLLLLLPLVGCSDEEKTVLTSALAGAWYPADAARLRAELDVFAKAATGEKKEGVRALIVPHAGYRWSGAVAYAAYRHVAGRTFSRVIVMGPSHRTSMQNEVSVPDVTHVATPLGEVPLDRDFVAALRRHPEFVSNPRAHGSEHSVQIQLPLLQHALGDFRLVPLVVGRLDAAATKRVADVLLELVDAETLLVVSSDFTHYGERFAYVPFTENVPANLRKLDMGSYERIRDLGADAFAAYVQATGTTVCGRRPIEVLLRMLPEATQVTLCRYDTSGRIGGRWENSVSYLGIAFETIWPEREEPAVEATKVLTREEKAALLKLARGTLEHVLAGEELPTPAALGIDLTPMLERQAGAFVTLRRDGKLRGCIGEIRPSRPLWRAVQGTAVGAALRDYRFRSVTAEELPEIDLKISVLTPPKPVAGWKEIELGRHGIVLQKQGRSATFLPQVAPEQGWDLDQTLTQLSLKAGLAADAWYEGATFLVFEAEVFGTPDE